jgi:oligopeptide/dipeptide ABC transporter ATP-binding protein
MVFQDPDASLNPRMTAAGLIGEPVALHHGLRGVALDARVCELMERVGLDPALRPRHPHAFSGGQRQRIGIARALAVEPELLLCDEVTSALDVSIQAQILALLAELQRDLGVAMLFITHDLGVVRHVAHRAAVMYLGELVEEASVESLFESPAHPYTRALLEAVPRLDGVAPRVSVDDEIPSPLDPPSGCRFHPRCPRKVERCSSDVPPRVEGPDRAARCFLAEFPAVDTPAGRT